MGAMPMRGGRLVEVVGHRDAHRAPPRHAQRRAEQRAVVSPGRGARYSYEFAGADTHAQGIVEHTGALLTGDLRGNRQRARESSCVHRRGFEQARLHAHHSAHATTHGLGGRAFAQRGGGEDRQRGCADQTASAQLQTRFG